MKKYLFILFVFVQFNHKVFSQEDFILQSFHRILPQSTLENPAFIPDRKIYVGLPFLSDFKVIASNKFSVSDLVREDAGDSLYVDLDGLLSKLDKRNRIRTGVNIGLLYTGVKIGDGFLSVTANLLNDIKFTYSDDLMNILIKGNGTEENLGREIRMRNIHFNGLTYYRVGAGYAHKFLENRLNLGARIYYLKGILNVETDDDNRGYFRTDPDSYNLELSLNKVRINTSGLNMFSEEADRRKQLFGSVNNGLSFDLGGMYELTSESDVYFSLYDMGFITWNYDTKNYEINEGNFVYEGVNIETVDKMESLLDSLEDIFSPEELTQNYRTGLSTGLSAGYSYRFGSTHSLNFLYNGIFFRNDYRFGISAGYGVDVREFLSARIAYTYLNYQPFNIGLGLSLRAGFFNFYLISDSITFVVAPDKARRADLRFGINLAFN